MAFTVRVPGDLGAAIEDAWEALGYRSANDYLNAVLAVAHKVPVPAYARPVRSETTASLLDDDMLRAG